MSYYAPVPDLGPRQRPAVVTTASYLLYVVAALVVVGGLISLATFHSVSQAVQDAYANTPDASTMRTAVKIGVVAGIIINVIEAALFVILGVFVGRGSNGMRITTWVIAGLGVLCFGCGAIGSGVTTSFVNNEQGTQRTATLRIEDAIPGWAHALTITMSVINLLLMIAIIVLLTLRPANDYFRRQPVGFVPGYPDVMPGGIYPGYPTATPGVPPTSPPWPAGPPANPPGGPPAVG